MYHETTALILAAGEGKRLAPITDFVQKCLIPLNGRPLLDYWLHKLRGTGIFNVGITAYAHAEQIKRYCETANTLGASRGRGHYTICQALVEDPLQGSARSLRLSTTKKFINSNDWDQILVIYGDNLSEINLKDLLAFHASNKFPISMALFRTDNPSQCGMVELDVKNTVIDFKEKPSSGYWPTCLANAGIYVISKVGWDEIIEKTTGKDIAEHVIPHFINRIGGYIFPGSHIDIGTMNNLSFAAQIAINHRITYPP